MNHRGTIAAAILTLFATGLACVLLLGMSHTAPAPQDVPRHSMNGLLQLLLTLSVVVFACRIVGSLATRIGQPAVIGEILAGLLLGPSVFGKLAPQLSDTLFPIDVIAQLRVLAEIGILLYMFIVGLELNLSAIGQHLTKVAVIANGGIAIPFAFGIILGMVLYQTAAGGNATPLSFGLFLGVALSVTAFPVLARILEQFRLTRTDTGVLAIGSAAVGDVTAWCLLAGFVGVVHGKAHGAIGTIILTLAYLLVMLALVRPVIARWVESLEDNLQPKHFGGVLLLLLLSGLVTEAIGIHAIFGAFFLGVIIPHSSSLALAIREKIEDVTAVLLLPAFFALMGLHTQLGSLLVGHSWSLCLVIIAVATLGKLGGTCLLARLTGSSWHQSFVLGTLMNTRGLMELIVLNVGREMGVISAPLFAAMVVMTLVTSAMTGPILVAMGVGGRSGRLQTPIDLRPSNRRESRVLVGQSS